MSLKSLIQDGKKIITIYGLGNVGGPIAAAWLRAGATVIGVDISKDLLSQIKDGTSHAKEPFISETFTKSLKQQKFTVTNDGIAASTKSHIKFIAVPVDMQKDKINLDFLLAATASVSHGLKKNDTVIVCPSLPPGVTSNAVRTILEKNSKLEAEKDFMLIYNPERIFEGQALQDIEQNYPAIISGYGKKSLQFADELLKIISKKGTVKMSCIENAEAEKLFEGVYRDVNIALANELADYCESAGVDFWDARKGANSQPSCHLHYPGTGVGGLCIPVYPKFILESSSKIGKSMKIIQHSRQTNDLMPKKCVKDAIDLLIQNKITPQNSKIAVLGLGFRGEVTDSRLSPTYEVVRQFLKARCIVTVHDPFIRYDSQLPSTVQLYDNLKTVTEAADLIFVSSDHLMYSKLAQGDFENAKKPLLIFDGRNILDKSKFKKSSILTIGVR